MMNDEIGGIVTSQKGQDKINVRGYLMVKGSKCPGKWYPLLVLWEKKVKAEQ